MNHKNRIEFLKNFFSSFTNIKIRRDFLEHLKYAENIFDEEIREQIIHQYEVYIKILDR